MEETKELDAMSNAIREMAEKQVPETSVEAPEQEVEKPTEVSSESVSDTAQEPAQEGAQEEEKPVENESEITLNFGEEAEQAAVVSEELKELISQRDALLAKLEEKESAQVFANEQIRKLNDYVLNGGKIDKNFWELQEKNYSEVDFKDDKSLLSVLKDKFMLLDGLTDSEANRMIQKQFAALSDKESADEDDIFDEMIQLKSLVRSELPKLQEIQNKASLPKEDKEAARRAEESMKLYQAEADKALGGISNFKLNLSDDLSLNIAKDKETEKSLRNLILYPENQQRYFVDNYVKDGKVDFERFANDEFFRIHKERIVKTAFNQGVSKGEKNILQKELRQENPQTQKSGDTQTDAKLWQEKLKQQFKNQVF